MSVFTKAIPAKFKRSLVALLGNLWFGEAVTAPHIGGIVLIVIGVGLLHAF